MKVINETLQKSARWKVKIPNLETEYREKIKQLKEQLKHKEQECEELKSVRDSWISKCEQETKIRELYQDGLDQLKAENEKMSKGYAELTEIVRPYIDDFTGYNEKLGGFDIVLCVKELLQQLDSLKAEVKSKTEYVQEQREIIDQYSKEIEMYKKYQGKRASKREEELKAENKELIRRITKIFACLIKANRTNKIVDTLWVDNITTLWDYIALTLGTEGDQVQIEKLKQKIFSKVYTVFEEME